MRRADLGWKLVLGFCLSLVFGACFGGEFAQGLPCNSDAECGPGLDCVEGFCGGLGDPALCGNGLRDVGEECDDGNRDEGDDCTSNCKLSTATCGDGLVGLGEVCDDGDGVETNECTTACTLSPEVPTLELSFAQVKQFEFHWEPALGAEYYELWERANDGEAFVQVGEDDLLGDSFSLTVPLRLRVNASYRLRACNTLRCVESADVDVVGTLAEAIGYFKASNTGGHDQFGGSVALSGDGSTLAVGAPGEASGATGNRGDNSALKAGAVYVFERTGQTWEQQAYIKASNAEADDQFGWSVALSDDGSTVAVGAYRKAGGAVYVFERTNQTWSQTYVKASNQLGDEFGWSVALSDDGNTLAVGADGESSAATGIDGQSDNFALAAGAAYVFERTGQTWEQRTYIKSSDSKAMDQFGWSVALSGKGNTLAVSTRRGRVYAFERTGQTWEQQAYVEASNYGVADHFGQSVALSDDGSTLAVGAPWESSNATGIDGNQDDDSASNAGAVYVFARTDQTWEQRAYVKASNTGMGDGFGYSVTLSGDGTTLAVGAPGESSGASGIDDDQGDDSASKAGAVYVFEWTNQTWEQRAYVKASNTLGGDFFGGGGGGVNGNSGGGGCGLAMSSDGTTLAVGAPGENYGTTGVGKEPEGAAFDSGAVYLY